MLNLILLILAFLNVSHAELRLDTNDTQIKNTAFKINPNYKNISSLRAADTFIKLLMRKTDLSNIELHKKNNIYEARLMRAQKISQISFQGLNIGNESELLRLIPLQVGQKLSNRKIEQSINAIRKYYANKAHYRADVTISPSSLLSNKSVMLKIDITEASKSKVSDFFIKSNNENLKRKLLLKLSKFKNKAFTESLIQKIENKANKYFANNRYISARLVQVKADYNSDSSEVQLFYRIENPVKYEFYFEGNQNISTSDLLRKIKASERQSDLINPVPKMRRKISEMYINKGYSLSKVNYNTSSGKNEYTSRVFFKIKEGQRIKIKKIKFDGRLSQDSKFYSKYLKGHSNKLISNGYYSKKGLEQGLENLEIHLNNQGFLLFKFLSQRIEYNKNKTSCNIYININEGPQSIINNINFKGNIEVSKQKLTDVIKLDNNSPLNLNEFEKSLSLLRQYYFDQGYLEMKIINEGLDNLIEYSSYGRKANINYEIYEGPQISVADIKIIGNNFTSSKVILRELYFEPGQILSVQKVKDSKSELLRMGLFSSVDIRTLDQGTKKENRTVLVTIREKDPGTVKLGIGITNSNNGLIALRGYSSVGYNNIGGKARAVSARIDAETLLDQEDGFAGRLSLGYLEPRLFFNKTRGLISGVISRDIIQVTGKENAPDEITFTQGTRLNFNIEHTITPKIRLNWLAWGLKTSDFFIKPTSEAEDKANNIRVGSIGPSLDIDYRTNPLNPTDNFYTRFDIKYASPGLGSSDLVNFLRLESEISFYIPLLKNKKLILATLFRGGRILNLSNEAGSGIPIGDSVFFGGSDTVRGFGGTNGSERIPGDRDILINPIEQPDQLIETEKVDFQLFKTELRYTFDKDWGISLFYDSGQVRLQGVPQVRTFRNSAGIGLRYNSPVGPIVVDYAVKFNRLLKLDNSLEKHGRIHFSIGTF